MTSPEPRFSVLVVEDEMLISAFMVDVLEGTRYKVVGVAPSADNALQIAQECKPDLALVDVKLRGTIDGIALADRLKQQHGIDCIFVTGSGDSQTVARMEAASPAGTLYKPFQTEGLLSALDRAAATRTVPV